MSEPDELIATVIHAPASSVGLRGRVFPFRGRVLVGRSPEADLRVDEPTVSRRHAELHTEGGAFLEVRAISRGSATFVNEEPLEAGEVQRLVHFPALLQVGGVLLQIAPQRRTEPWLEALAVGGPLPGQQAARGDVPLLHISRDGDACAVRVLGRHLEIPGAAARVLWELGRNAGRVVHQWELQDAAGAEANLPQLVSVTRRALRRLVEKDVLQRTQVEALMRRAAEGERLEALGEESLEALMRKLILSRRRHGYVLCLPPEVVLCEELG